MGYAVRNDGVYGVRAVDGPDDCMEHETYSDVFVERTDTLEDQLAAIEAKCEQKQAELDKALVAALRMGGAQEAAARAAIKQKSLKLIQDQNDEIDALSAQQ